MERLRLQPLVWEPSGRALVATLESRLLERLSEDELAALRREAERELAEPGRWGTTFTLIQSWGRLDG